MKSGTNWQRGNGSPLISTKELAAEFGVSVQKLSSLMAHSDIPPPKKIFLSGHGSTRNSWYEPASFRAWWKQINVTT